MHCLYDLEFDQLPATERLVLVSLRARNDGCRGASSVETMYRIACGLAWVERAVASFESMLCVLFAGCRRPLRVQDLAATGVSLDEQCLVALLAAHQFDERAQAEGRARWLVRREFLDPLQLRAEAFAHALARSGCKLSRSWIHPGKLYHHRVSATDVHLPVKLTRIPKPRGLEEASG